MIRLKYVDLRQNKLTHIGDFSPLFDGRIRLYGNPWDCEQQLSWMSGLNNSDVEKLRCETPYYLRGMFIFKRRK